MSETLITIKNDGFPITALYLGEVSSVPSTADIKSFIETNGLLNVDALLWVSYSSDKVAQLVVTSAFGNGIKENQLLPEEPYTYGRFQIQGRRTVDKYSVHDIVKLIKYKETTLDSGAGTGNDTYGNTSFSEYGVVILVVYKIGETYYAIPRHVHCFAGYPWVSGKFGVDPSFGYNPSKIVYFDYSNFTVESGARQYSVDLTDDIAPYVPPPVAPKGTLFFNKSEKNKVDKDIELLANYDIIFKNPVDILNPTIDIKTDDIENIVKNANYMYVDQLGRYYFITDMEIIRNGLVRISGRVDVLMTYSDKIREQRGIIARNEKIFNLYGEDNEFRFDARPIIKVKSFTKYTPVRREDESVGMYLSPSFAVTIAGGEESQSGDEPNTEGPTIEEPNK